LLQPADAEGTLMAHMMNVENRHRSALAARDGMSVTQPQVQYTKRSLESYPLLIINTSTAHRYQVVL
jgi:hypothetical protein